MVRKCTIIHILCRLYVITNILEQCLDEYIADPNNGYCEVADLCVIAIFSLLVLTGF